MTKVRQVYDTKEELASNLLATAVKIQNKGTAQALKDRELLCMSFSANSCYSLGGTEEY